jgi:hypothetical protein
MVGRVSLATFQTISPAPPDQLGLYALDSETLLVGMADCAAMTNSPIS